jgi:phytoene dehydrogenase-like protein
LADAWAAASRLIDQVVVVGAGIGGLTAGALLAKSGLDVTVLEAHVYHGGCAGTFYHHGFRFDAGATLAAGFEPGGGMARLGQVLGITWPVEPAARSVERLPWGRVHQPRTPRDHSWRFVGAATCIAKRGQLLGAALAIRRLPG